MARCPLLYAGSEPTKSDEAVPKGQSKTDQERSVQEDFHQVDPIDAETDQDQYRQNQTAYPNQEANGVGKFFEITWFWWHGILPQFVLLGCTLTENLHLNSPK